MLRISTSAASLISEEARRNGVGNGGGMRMFIHPDERGPTEVRVEFVDGPQDGDQVVVQDRARVFVAEAVVPLVSTFTLDAGPDGGSTEELILR
jgi:Fe-S cluster assembly iron-binding protein IscA